MNDSSPRGVKAVAMLEATKGMATLLVCFGLYELVGYNLHHLLIRWATGLNIAPDNQYVQELAAQAERVTPDNLYIIIGIGLFYAMVRFIEAFGLWRGYVWTKWFAVISGAVYVPFEVIELFNNLNWISMSILLINIGIVVYVYLNIDSRSEKTPPALNQ